MYPGFRLLGKYFTLPQKFAFFDVTGLEQMPVDKLTDRFAILIHFRDGMPSGTRVSKENLRLFCSPVVNLFDHATDPIKPDPTKHEYLARSTGSTPTAYEIYSIDKVIAGSPATHESARAQHPAVPRLPGTSSIRIAARPASSTSRT